MNEDRMTPEALAEIEGKAKKCADNKLPALALIFSTERELALDAVPQMAAEIRRAWALIQKVYEVADEERFTEVTDIIDAENGGTHE